MALRALLRLLVLAIILAAGVLLWRNLQGYSLAGILDSVAAMPPLDVLAALGYCGMSYLTLTLFDWLAVRHAGFPLPWRKVAPASFCALSLGHNIGFSGISSGAIRYRFYSRLGLKVSDVAVVIVFCGLTVTLGLVVLAGLVLLLRPDLAGATLRLGPRAAMAVGAACLLLGALWLVACTLVRRPLVVRGKPLRLPRPALAAAQLVVGPLNFGFVAAALHEVLKGTNDPGYAPVAAAYVMANAGAIVTHVPGGLGVLEGVLLLLLPGAPFIAALIVFRFLYYLLPLALGGTALALTETFIRHRARLAGKKKIGRSSA